LKPVFGLLNEIKLLAEKKSSDAEETDHEERTTDRGLFLFVIGHCNKLKEEQKR
jgi:hypothetical protein